MTKGALREAKVEPIHPCPDGTWDAPKDRNSHFDNFFDGVFDAAERGCLIMDETIYS